MKMNDSHLSLNWRCHHSVLMSTFQHLLENNILLDCTLSAEGQCLNAHRVILAASSPYFQLLFSQETEKHPIIILKDVKFQELNILLEFMYKGEVEIPEQQLKSFLNLANSLEIKGLKNLENYERREVPAFSGQESAIENSNVMSPLQSATRSQQRSQDCCYRHSKITVPLENGNSSYCQETNCAKGCLLQDDLEVNSKKAGPSHQRKLPFCEQTRSESKQLSEGCKDHLERKIPSATWCFPSCLATGNECDHRFQKHVKVCPKKALLSNKNNFQCHQLSDIESEHVFELCSEIHPKKTTFQKTHLLSHKTTTSQGVHTSLHHEKTILPQKNITIPCLPLIEDESEHELDSQDCLQRHCKKAAPQKSMLPSHQVGCSKHVHISQDHHEDNCRETALTGKCHSQCHCCPQTLSNCVNVFRVHFECNCNTAVSSSKNNSTNRRQTSSESVHVSQGCCESHCARKCLPQKNIPSCQNTKSAHRPTSGDCLEEQGKKTAPEEKKDKSQSNKQETNIDCQNIFQVHIECSCKTTGSFSNNNSPSSQQTISECVDVSPNGTKSYHQSTVSLRNNSSVPCQQEHHHISQDCVESCNTADSQQRHGSQIPVGDCCVSQNHLQIDPECSSPVGSLATPNHQIERKAIPSSGVPASLISKSTNGSRSSKSIIEHVQSNKDNFPQSDHIREMCAEPSKKSENIVECNEKYNETIDSTDTQKINNTSKMGTETQNNIQIITLSSDEENELNSSADFENENCSSETCEEPPENIENIAICSDVEMNDSSDMQNIKVSFHEPSSTKETGPRITSIHCTTGSDSLIFNCVASDSDCNENTNQLKDRLLSYSEIISLAQASVERTELTEYIEDQSHIPRKRIRIQEEKENVIIDCRNVAIIPGECEDSPTNTQENSFESDHITKAIANRNYNFADEKQQLSSVPNTVGKVPVIAAIISVRNDLLPSDSQNSCQLENITGSFLPPKPDFCVTFDSNDIKEELLESENIQENSTNISPEVLKCNEIPIKGETLELENSHKNVSPISPVLKCDGINDRDKTLGLEGICGRSSPNAPMIIECYQIDIKEEPLHEIESELDSHSEASVSNVKVQFQPNCSQSDRTSIEGHCDDIYKSKVTKNLEMVDNKLTESKPAKEIEVETKSTPNDKHESNLLEEEINCGLEHVSTEVSGTRSDCVSALHNSSSSNTSVTTNEMHLKLSPTCPENIDLENRTVVGPEGTGVASVSLKCSNTASDQEIPCDKGYSDAASSLNATEEQDTSGHHITDYADKQVATTSQNQGSESVLGCVAIPNSDAFKHNNAKRQKITHSPECNASVSELQKTSTSIMDNIETVGSPNQSRPGSVGNPESIASLEDDYIMRSDTICNISRRNKNHDTDNASEDDTDTDKSKFSSVEDDDNNDEDELISKGYWHTCSRCGKNFAFMRCLEKHLREHKRERARRCTECGKVFPNLYILNRHKVIHLDHPCKCNECGKIFRRSDHLQQHQQLHMREHSFKCQQCGKAFLRSDHLVRHQQESHPGARSYICNECRMAFTNAHALALHKQLHSRQRSHPHKCQDCGKAFKHSENLLHHQQVHKKKKSYA